MIRRGLFLMLLCGAAAMASGLLTPSGAEAAPPGQPSDWSRFYHYPYVYYPHSFEKPKTYNNLYYKYPQSRQIPVYNQDWHNFYPTERPWHKGHHFILDVF